MVDRDDRELMPQEDARDDRIETPPYETPTLTHIGDAVRLALGSASNDTADMARYYY